VVVTISAEREPKLGLWQLIVPEIVEHDFCWDAISAGTRFWAGTRSMLERATWLARVPWQQGGDCVTRKLNYVSYRGIDLL
jgi:hypothetical protein